MSLIHTCQLCGANSFDYLTELQRHAQELADQPGGVDAVELSRDAGADRLPMKKPKKDPVREDRIHNEAIADANGPEEQVMGWYYYLEDKIRFPFQGQVHRCQSRFTAPEGRNRRSPAVWHRKTPAPPTCSC